MKIINAEAAGAHPGRKAGASVPPPAGGSQYCQNHEPGIKHHQPVINHSLIRLPPGNGRLRHTCCKPRRKQQNTVLLQAPLDSVMRKYIISQKEQKQIQSDTEGIGNIQKPGRSQDRQIKRQQYRNTTAFAPRRKTPLFIGFPKQH